VRWSQAPPSRSALRAPRPRSAASVSAASISCQPELPRRKSASRCSSGRSQSAHQKASVQSRGIGTGSTSAPGRAAASPAPSARTGVDAGRSSRLPAPEPDPTENAPPGRRGVSGVTTGRRDMYLYICGSVGGRWALSHRGSAIDGKSMSAIWAAPGPTGKFVPFIVLSRESLNHDTNVCAICV
jgi:hypothetical protein